MTADKRQNSEREGGRQERRREGREKTEKTERQREPCFHCIRIVTLYYDRGLKRTELAFPFPETMKTFYFSTFHAMSKSVCQMI